ncbi:MAG: hypothetical protein U5K71_09395 [Gracilimonas sp.]|nr:hypothetical protein [Gracilimonas sp.]
MKDDNVSAQNSYQKALKHNPFHLEARSALVEILNETGDQAEAQALTEEAGSLEIPLGPDFTANNN